MAVGDIRMGKIADFAFHFMKNLEIRKFFGYRDLFNRLKQAQLEAFSNISIDYFIKEIEKDPRYEVNFNNDAVSLKEWALEDDDGLMYQDPNFD